MILVINTIIKYRMILDLTLTLTLIII